MELVLYDLLMDFGDLPRGGVVGQVDYERGLEDRALSIAQEGLGLIQTAEPANMIQRRLNNLRREGGYRAFHRLDLYNVLDIQTYLVNEMHLVVVRIRGKWLGGGGDE